MNVLRNALKIDLRKMESVQIVSYLVKCAIILQQHVRLALLIKSSIYGTTMGAFRQLNARSGIM